MRALFGPRTAASRRSRTGEGSPDTGAKTPFVSVAQAPAAAGTRTYRFSFFDLAIGVPSSIDRSPPGALFEMLAVAGAWGEVCAVDGPTSRAIPSFNCFRYSPRSFFSLSWEARSA